MNQTQNKYQSNFEYIGTCNMSGSFDVAFLLAPDIVFPTRMGNAIASLVDVLAQGLDKRSIVFCYNTQEDISELEWERSYTFTIYQKSLANSI